MNTTRRLVDTAALLLMMVGTLWGFGLLGSPVNQTNGGALSAEATLLAPSTTAFSIWSVIYLLLVAYVVWVWTPSGGRSRRAASLGWLPAASMVLNGAWLAITQAGGLWLSVVDIAALALVLGLLMRRLMVRRPAGTLEALLLDGTFGLYLGWVTVATCANVTAAAVASGANLGRVGNTVAAVVVLVVAAALGVTFSRVYRGAGGVAAAMVWGLGWIAHGRLAVGPHNTVVGVVAALSALVVLAAFLRLWWRAESLRGSNELDGAVAAN
ncbi:tryptophan-rich sensory protein [Aestuariimicrobium kwangyangense]|uniref:tryptophan-rich sensory protein n=1 Tax=Aestuariimicrobium kwangyangense TaxID=396389 RepID=UPI00040A62CF|nr:tryptophan-rich sensory protein [Aestuariimicrobium kwangyangense]